MSEHDLPNYVGYVDLLDSHWNQYFCQVCKGSGISSDRFFMERICTACYGRGEKPVFKPQIIIEMRSYSLEMYGLFYITGIFHRFNDGVGESYFLYQDLIWRNNLVSQKSVCFFTHERKAKKILEQVS